MELYSYKGQEPSILPERIRLDDGSTRTSLDKLTQGELEDIGFVGPIEKPIYNKINQNLDWNGTNYSVVSTVEKPYPSWILDENNNWISPVPEPTEAVDGKMYSWDEETLSWIEI